MSCTDRKLGRARKEFHRVSPIPNRPPESWPSGPGGLMWSSGDGHHTLACLFQPLPVSLYQSDCCTFPLMVVPKGPKYFM